MNLINDLLLGAIFFLTYIGVRASWKNHSLSGIGIGIILIFLALLIIKINPYYAEILIIIGFLIIAITSALHEKEEEDD